ncbi:MAG: glycoside hydrolase family 88 protein [Bacteroidales bacterium]|jgi:unsaturated rhamnogalacturonyl hydrolase|nr:glycoside hydrolase family 88 protein [Bacteroidales bacterium]MCI2122457.1 glycoside hydrolase family 88 protein [Bacteroidales bacterium]MCI2145290.1 glycoside hydrolase family 88 protein [Bacteroidales bacterium]
MKNIRTVVLIPVALAVLMGCGSAGCAAKGPSDSTGFEWEGVRLSEKMLSSEIRRNPDASWIDGQEGNLKWNYTTGLELLSFLDVYDAYGGDSILNYVSSWYDGIISDDGTIYSYKLSNYVLDHICPGEALLKLGVCSSPKYALAAATLRRQLSEQPRIPDGGFWHKKAYPNQMWLDGIYMAEPFYADYAVRFESGTRRDSSLNDVADQFVLIARHTCDDSTGLYRHAYDDSRKMFWCDPVTGRSKHAWGRAMGWYAMAMADVLEIMPEDFPRREEIVSLLKGIVSKLPAYADPETGMWYQVMDCPGKEGNYVEATCSAMFCYAMLKGIRIRVLEKSLMPYAEKCYRQLCSTFLESNADGTLTLKKCCAVAGLGGKENRSGDYDYYINCKVIDNDPKGIGPFIMASLEYEKIK